MTDDVDDFQAPLRICDVNGEPIRSLDDWRTRAAPAGGDKHWRPGRSALVLARAWVGTGTAAMPDDVARLFTTAVEMIGFRPGLARPEAKLPLDSFRGNTRNADLLLYGTAAAGRTVVTVEAKADESFGRYVADELRRVEDKPTSNLPRRIAQLATLVFGDPTVAQDVRYQLLHGLAATVLETQRRNAEQGAFVIHEFRSTVTDDRKQEANHEDLRRFGAHLGVEVVPGRLERISLAGEPSVRMFLGLVTTEARRDD
jgi:hypothetical protein